MRSLMLHDDCFHTESESGKGNGRWETKKDPNKHPWILNNRTNGTDIVLRQQGTMQNTQSKRCWSTILALAPHKALQDYLSEALFIY